MKSMAFDTYVDSSLIQEPFGIQRRSRSDCTERAV